MRDKFEDLKSRIQDRIPKLSDSQKIIADYIVENPETFALSSIRELEKELKTSKSTIVRLAQSLGYDGFHELKNEFLQMIRQDLSPINRYKSFLYEPAGNANFVKLLAEEAVNNINTTMHLLDRKQYDRAVRIIKESNHVYTLGLGISTYLGQIASYLFNRVSIKADAMPSGGLSFAEQIINLDRRDVLFAFSFPPYSPETVEAAAYASERKIKVIAVTDRVTADIVPHVDAYLQVAVETKSVSNCITAVLVLISALASHIGFDQKERTLEGIKTVETLRQRHRDRKA